MDKSVVDNARIQAGSSAVFIDAVAKALPYAQVSLYKDALNNRPATPEQKEAIFQLAVAAVNSSFEDRRTEAITKELQFLSHAVAHSNRY